MYSSVKPQQFKPHFLKDGKPLAETRLSVKVIDNGPTRVGLTKVLTGTEPGIDIRKYTINSTCHLHPTTHGLVIGLNHAVALAHAILQVHSELVTENPPPAVFYFAATRNLDKEKLSIPTAQVFRRLKDAVEHAPAEFGAKFGCIFKSCVYVKTGNLYWFDATEPVALWPKSSTKWKRPLKKEST